MTNAAQASPSATTEVHRLLEAVGPQLEGEGPFNRRVRFHQSWYRARRLRLSTYGQTPGPRPKPLGSILSPDDAAAGLNLLDDFTFALYKQRRGEGWGLDPVRCLAYMTSSQAMTLNIVGAFHGDLAWIARTLQEALPRDDILDVESVQLEFGGNANPLGDKTMVDILLRIRTTAGNQTIVVESKLADRFNSRHVPFWRNERYGAVMSRHPIWTENEPALQDRGVNQLFRCHALGIAVAEEHESPAQLILAHHPEDRSAGQALARYRSVLRESSGAEGLTLTRLFAAMELTAPCATTARRARTLVDRYCNHGLSEVHWLESLAVGAQR